MSNRSYVELLLYLYDIILVVFLWSSSSQVTGMGSFQILMKSYYAEFSGTRCCSRGWKDPVLTCRPEPTRNSSPPLSGAPSYTGAPSFPASSSAPSRSAILRQSTSQRNSQLQSSCQIFFSFCLTHDQENLEDNAPCTFGYKNTQPLEPGARFPLRPINLTFEHRWQKDFVLILSVWQNNSTSSELVPGSPRILLSRDVIRSSVVASSHWTEVRLATTPVTLTYSYRVVCKSNYYGETCSSFCKPRDDFFGHYACLPDGTRMCNSGWNGEYCNQPICSEGCNAEHGSCEQPNECKCRMGWEGRRCDECMRYPGCKHGTCREAWRCDCLPDWSGLFCDTHKESCSDNKQCLNGGRCEMDVTRGFSVCQCLNGFTGSHCQRRVCDDTSCSSVQPLPACSHEICLNGGICLTSGNSDISIQCLCTPGFTGPRCEFEEIIQLCRYLPAGVCQNGGTCIDMPGHEFSCSCRPGFSGSLCQIHTNDCTVRPCAQGGFCASTLDGLLRCVCPAGLTGSYCDDRLNCLVTPCFNNGVCSNRGTQCDCSNGYYGSRCEYHGTSRMIVLTLPNWIDDSVPSRQSTYNSAITTWLAIAISILFGIVLSVLFIILRRKIKSFYRAVMNRNRIQQHSIIRNNLRLEELLTSDEQDCNTIFINSQQDNHNNFRGIHNQSQCSGNITPKRLRVVNKNISSKSPSINPREGDKIYDKTTHKPTKTHRPTTYRPNKSSILLNGYLADCHAYYSKSRNYSDDDSAYNELMQPKYELESPSDEKRLHSISGVTVPTENYNISICHHGSACRCADTYDNEETVWL